MIVELKYNLKTKASRQHTLERGGKVVNADGEFVVNAVDQFEQINIFCTVFL